MLAQRKHAELDEKLEKEFLVRVPDALRLHVIFADRASDRGDATAEKNRLDAGLKKCPESSELLVRRAQYFVKASRGPIEAEKKSEHLEKAATDLKAAEVRNPTDVTVRLAMADQWLAIGNQRPALKKETIEKAKAQVDAANHGPGSDAPFEFEREEGLRILLTTSARLCWSRTMPRKCSSSPIAGTKSSPT